MTNANPYWNERSSTAITEYAINGLFYIEKKHPDPSDTEAVEAWEKLWQTKLFNKVITGAKKPATSDFIPIMVGYDDIKAYEE